MVGVLAGLQARGAYRARVAESPVRKGKEGVTVAVWVVPGASRSQLVGLHGDKLKIRVVAPPEGGRANAEVISVLTEALGTDVELVAGSRSRSKMFRVARLDAGTVRRKLGLS
jgi:uncharacterized protein (TIGR00251 family)